MTETVMKLINNCLFPVAACIAMGIYISKTQQQANQIMQELKASIDTLTAVVMKQLDKD